MGCPGNLGDKLILALILLLSIILIMVNIKFYFSQDEEISEYYYLFKRHLKAFCSCPAPLFPSLGEGVGG
jgi:hypothetical protein